MNPCGICGCEETKIRDVDQRHYKDYPHVDRYYICVKCGSTRGIATIMPYDGDWSGFELHSEF